MTKIDQGDSSFSMQHNDLVLKLRSAGFIFCISLSIIGIVAISVFSEKTDRFPIFVLGCFGMVFSVAFVAMFALDQSSQILRETRKSLDKQIAVSEKQTAILRRLVDSNPSLGEPWKETEDSQQSGGEVRS